MKIKILAILVLLAGIAYAANEFTARNDIDIASGTYRDVAVDDSSVVALTAAHAELVNGCPKVAVSIHFESGAATANITFVRGHGTGAAFVPHSATKAVATGNNKFKDRDGFYFANDIVFETEGYSSYIVLVDTISTGTCSVWRSRY